MSVERKVDDLYFITHKKSRLFSCGDNLSTIYVVGYRIALISLQDLV